MKLSHEKIIFDQNQEVHWSDVESLRVLNGTLVIVLSNNKTLEIKDLSQSNLDNAFRAYEFFLQEQHKQPSGPRSLS